MSDATVLLTGAGGLMGRYVAEELRAKWRIKGLDLLPAAAYVEHTEGSVEDYDTVLQACQGVDTVVHIAARPNIWSGSGSEIVHTNVTGTWNVLDAAEKCGVRRVILTSSDSVIGYTVLQGKMVPPSYLPIDSAHPLNATDPYALSKVLCERMGRSFALRAEIEVLAIRPVYVLYPEFECEVLARAADPQGYVGPAAGGRQPAGGGLMWQYVDPRDVARAFRLSLTSSYRGFDAYLISAASTLAPEPTVDRLTRILGRSVQVVRPEVYERNPYAPIYDLDHARDGIGFSARYDTRKRLGLDAADH